ncbi:MAG TPA: aminomethyl-transferring glycine dehydrogenase subunit GcvPB [Actinomycetota bacterium]|nr:aminomethyl-transferring glycine dehydrogenase subunit GcvPB [Actinomycetota bacterium]
MSGRARGPEPQTIFDVSAPGRRASSVAQPAGSPAEGLIPPGLRRASPPRLPEVSELDLVRHYTRLSQRNWAIDVGVYPLGSCTMKYNPKVHEDVAGLPGFRNIHPWQPADQVQGALQLLWEMEQYLAELTGMARVTFQPAAGAQGELTGLLIMRAHHTATEGHPRSVVLIPDSAHGTNPASVALGGYKVRQIPSDERGLVDLAALEAALDPSVAGLMLTNPNTLGLFETDIERIAAALHRSGGLLYFDGANFNAILGKVRPGDMGFDIVHMNTHKTFTTPHGGGGPGSGPVAVSARLAQYLPSPVVGYDEAANRWFWDTDRPQSIGRLHGFHGNFGVVVRAYTYLRSLGGEGLVRIAERAVLNANYLRALVREAYPEAHPGTCMHEFVCTAKPLRAKGVRAMDVAKRLIDLGFHPPTVYFPLVVEEAMMVEPTETESRESLDALAAALLQIAGEASSDPELLHEAPVTAPVGRLDEARAARRLHVRWEPGSPWLDE